VNVSQLERIRMMISSIRAEVQTDVQGTSIISEAVGELHEVVTDALKNEVWARYMEEVK